MIKLAHSQHDQYSHMAEVTGLCFNDDGLTLLSTSQDKRIVVWDCVDGKRISTLFDVVPIRKNDHVTRCPVVTTCNYGTFPVVFVPLAAKIIAMFNLYTGKMINQLHGHYGKVNTVICKDRGSFVIFFTAC